MKQLLSLSLLLAAISSASAADDADELAKELANPVASLISLPLQNNFDFGIGALDGWRYTLNVQPVIPFELNSNWNLITRTIVPYVYQEDVIGQSSQSGLSDVVQSFFFAPRKPVNGWVIGAGPVFLYPSATDDLLGGEKWGAGPTAVLLKQTGQWSYGALVNHLWSFAGNDARGDVNATSIQPFVNFRPGKGLSIALSSESSYDWEARQWTVPIALNFGKVSKIGSQPVSYGIGAKYTIEGPDGAPEWGVRASITLIFKK